MLKPAASVACDCSPPEWQLSLVSVTDEPGAPDDAAYWPAEGVVAPLPSAATLRFVGGDSSWELEANAR